MGIDEGSPGNELFQKVTELTGLPNELISLDLKNALAKVNSSPSTMTIEDLRKAVLCYMMEVFGEGVPDGFSQVTQKKPHPSEDVEPNPAH